MTEADAGAAAGSAGRRETVAQLRQAVKDFKGHDIGEYSE